MSAISRLPPEMLGKVFIDSLPDVGDVWEKARGIANDYGWTNRSTMPLEKQDYFRPFTLSAVCRRWNEVALATPRLWSFIVIDVEEGAEGFRALETWLKRSGSSPLTLIFASIRPLEEYPPFFHRYLGIIFAHIERWEHIYMVFSLTGLDGDVDAAQQQECMAHILIQGSSAPLLRSAFVSISGERAAQRLIVSLRSALLGIFISPGTTGVNQVYLRAPSMNSFSYPSPFSATSLSMTTMIIRGVTTITAVALLLSCPNIQDFTVSIAFDLPSGSSLLYSTEPLAQPIAQFLPYLHRLNVTCHPNPALKRILSCFNAPALTCLQIAVGSSGSWSGTGLRDALITCFSKSGCHITSFRLCLYGSDLIEDVEFPLPLKEECWKYLEESYIKGLSHPQILDFYSLSPVLNKIMLELPFHGTHVGDVCLPSLRQMFVRAQAPDHMEEVDYNVLSVINFPRLDNFILWWSPPDCHPDLHPSAPNWSGLALEQLLSKSGNLSHLCLVCEPIEDDPTHPELLASYLLDILRLPNVNSNLQTLILCGRGIVLSNAVMDYLTLSRSQDLDVALPRLRDIVFLHTAMVSDDGKLADMIASRFQYGSLDSFHVHLDAFIGQALPKDIQEPPLLHHEDEQKLIELKWRGRDVLIERGKDWLELCYMMEELDEELQHDISRHFGKFSLTKAWFER